MTEEESERLLPISNPATEANVQSRLFQKFKIKSYLIKKFPIIQWLPNYRWQYFQCDMIAGITVAMTVIPQGLAYAKIAGLLPQYGLYSAFMGCFVYSIFGTAKDITLGPTAIMSLMTASFGSSPIQNDPTYALILTFIGGFVQLLMGLFNLGFLIRFISAPVLSAFTTAAAITIGFTQVKNILGLKNIPKHFLECVYYTFAKLGETNVWDLILGIFCIIVLHIIKKLRTINWDDEGEPITLSQKIARKFLWILGTAANSVVVIGAAGIAAAIISVYPDKATFTLTGEIQSGLPPFKIPKFSISHGNITQSTAEIFSNIGPGFFIIPFIGIIETIAIGKSFARKNCYKLDATQEFVALGVANIFSSFVSSYPIAGSFSRTAVNSQSSVKTPAGGIITGTVVIVALILLTPAFKYIPNAALAAIIMSAVLQMVDFKIIRRLWNIQKVDFFIYILTLIGSFALGVEYGILIGIGLSLFPLLYPLSQPDIQIQDSSIPVIWLELGLQFPASEYFEDRIIDLLNTSGRPQAVIIDCKNVFRLDYTAVKTIEKIITHLEHHNISLVLTGLKANEKNKLTEASISPLQFSSSVESAIEQISKEFSKI